MSDIALTLPAANRAAPRPRARAPFARVALAVTYLAFALSVAFTFAVVIGVIHSFSRAIPGKVGTGFPPGIATNKELERFIEPMKR